MSDASQTAGMPAYVERSGEQELVPPCGLYGTQYYIFVIKGDRGKLQNLLDRTFNEPSGGAVHYEAFSSYVIVMFTHVDKLTSSQPSQGWAAYRDIAMWVPLFDRKGILPVFKMYPITMVVDNGSTMATGREMYGFPKEMGWFIEPQNPDFIGDLVLDVVGYAADSPVKQCLRSRLWTIRRENADAPAGFHPLATLRDLYDELEKAMSFIHSNLEDEFIIGLDILKGLGQVPALGLKQIRDVQYPAQAAFQAICEAPLGLTRLRGLRLLTDKYTFILEDLETHPVASDTGLTLGAQDIAFACWLYGDFDLGTGTTNWEYGANRDANP
jgi:hypothetical protein